MADIASLAGVAKGTLYNHFRTKDAVYAAALDTGIRALAEECGAVAPDDLGEALALAADRLASHPALQRIASDEPAVFASFARLGVGGAWPTARAAVHEVLTAAGCEPSDASVELVLRWLVSFAGANGTDIRAQAAAVAAGIEHTKVTAVRS
jgi:AcrR family transcriptional regulator